MMVEMKVATMVAKMVTEKTAMKETMTDEQMVV